MTGKHDSTTLSVATQPPWWATAARTASSSPLSVTCARSSTWGSVIRYRASFRLSAGLTTGSPTAGSSTGGCRRLVPTSRTGASNTGLV